MAGNKIQIKRTTVSGRTPNTSSSSNTQYIAQGELALNLADKKLFSSDGVNAIEIGSNVTTINVSGNIYSNSLGSNSVFLFNQSGQIGGAETITFNPDSGTITVGNTSSQVKLGYISDISAIQENQGNQNNYVQISGQNFSNGSSASFDFAAYNDDATYGTYIDMGISSSNWSNSEWTISGPNDGYLYTSNGNLTIGANTVGGHINFFTDGTLSNNERMRIDNNYVTVNATLVVPPGQGFSANGSVGVDGQILVSNGTSPFWSFDFVGSGNVSGNYVTANTLESAQLSIGNGAITVGNSPENTRIGNSYFATGNTSVYTQANSTAIYMSNTPSILAYSIAFSPDSYLTTGYYACTSLSISTDPIAGITNPSFTIEGYLYVNSTPSSSNATIWSDGSFAVGVDTSDRLNVYANFGGSPSDNIFIYTPEISTKTWYHFAVVGTNSGSQTAITVYLNGVSQTTTTVSGYKSSFPSNSTLPTSSIQTFGQSLDGYLSSFRLSEGNRYTGNFTQSFNALNQSNFAAVTGSAGVNTAQFTTNILIGDAYWDITKEGGVFSVGPHKGLAGPPVITATGTPTLQIFPSPYNANVEARYGGSIYVGNNSTFTQVKPGNVNLQGTLLTISSEDNANTLTFNSSGFVFTDVSGSGNTLAANSSSLTLNGLSAVFSNNANYANNTYFVGDVSAANVVSNSQLQSNLANYVNTSGNYTVSGNLNFNATNTYFTTNIYAGAQIVVEPAGDLIFSNGSGIQANGTFGTAGQFLTTDGSGSLYWKTQNSASSFTNGQSISVNNFVVSGALTANGSNGEPGEVLTSDGSVAYWSNDFANISYASNATNINTGTLSYSVIPSNIVNTTAEFTFANTITFNGVVNVNNTLVDTAGNTGAFGQYLTAVANGVEWTAPYYYTTEMYDYTAYGLGWSNIAPNQNASTLGFRTDVKIPYGAVWMLVTNDGTVDSLPITIYSPSNRQTPMMWVTIDGSGTYDPDTNPNGSDYWFNVTPPPSAV